MNLTQTPDRPLSRSASRASARSGKSKNSTLSRNQSLIKKNIELQDLKPADVLIERFVAWKAIVKQLTAYFEGIADIENNTAKEMIKLAGVIQVPFRAGNQFLGQGGLQDVYFDIRDKTRIIADHHADLGRTIDSSIVQHLQKLRVEIKAHIKNVQNDTGKLAASVAREREISTKLVGELANAISTFKNTPMNIQAKADPYVANAAVARQLQRQVLEENLLQKSIIMMQQNSAHFEEGIVKAIQSAWATFDEWAARSSASSQALFRGLATHMAQLQPDREWIQFAARSDHLLHPDTPLRDPSNIIYPLKDDPSVHAVHTGHLERKKRFSRAWGEAYFILTPAGFLHEFPASLTPADPRSTTPVFSLFLPNCTLGPPSSPRSRANKFHIEGTRDGTGVTSRKSGSFKGWLGGGGEGNQAKAWSFRCRSREEMMEWWNDIRMLCARYLVASEAVDRTGPVEEAVRSAGYASAGDEEYDDEDEDYSTEDDEELVREGELAEVDTGVVEERERRESAAAARRAAVLGGEDEGSSVEEEEYEEPPVYSHPVADSKGRYPIEIGANGYALDKKPRRSASGRSRNGVGVDYPLQQSSALAPPIPSSEHDPTAHLVHAPGAQHPTVETGPHADVHSVRAERGALGEGLLGGGGAGGQGEVSQAGGRVGRRLSKRQKEKARESAVEPIGGPEVDVDHGAGADVSEAAVAPPPIPASNEDDMYASDENREAYLAPANGAGGAGKRSVEAVQEAGESVKASV